MTCFVSVNICRSVTIAALRKMFGTCLSSIGSSISFTVPFEMNELIAVQVFAFDAEQNDSDRSWALQASPALSARRERCLYRRYFEPAVSITKIRAAARCHPHRRLSLDWRAFVIARPRDSIVALALRREAELCLSLGVGLQRPGSEFRCAHILET